MARRGRHGDAAGRGHGPADVPIGEARRPDVTPAAIRLEVARTVHPRPCGGPARDGFTRSRGVAAGPLMVPGFHPPFAVSRRGSAMLARMRMALALGLMVVALVTS